MLTDNLPAAVSSMRSSQLIGVMPTFLQALQIGLPRFAQADSDQRKQHA